MTFVVVAAGVAAWIGGALLLSELRWFSRAPLAERLRPYAPGGMGRPARGGLLSAATLREAVGPLARTVGARASRVVGVGEDLEIRLLRIHAPIDVTGFRIRQVAGSVAAFGAAVLLTVPLRVHPAVALLVLLAAPALAFLVQEQRVAAASARWQRRLFLELPVVAEQLALLLSAGYSLTAALNRIAARSTGACGADLDRACLRIRQGLPAEEALREWAAVARVPAVDRLVPVLALSRDTSDLGRLVADEARSVRRDVQRERVEAAERRAEQVWIPVTIATLVPGVIFIAVPFVEALRVFGG